MKNKLFGFLIILCIVSLASCKFDSDEVKITGSDLTVSETQTPGNTDYSTATDEQRLTPSGTTENKREFISQYNFSLKIPSHWHHRGNRPIGAKDGYFYIEPPNTAYLQENGVKGMGLENVCNSLITLNNKAAPKLGYKPFGEDPQLEYLKADGQPACVIFPSSDQSDAANNRAAAIIQLPQYFPARYKSPPLFNYIEITADTKHIRGLVKSIHFAEPTVFEDNATPFSPLVEGAITLKDQRVSTLALSSRYIYWTYVSPQSAISRYSFASDTVENQYLSSQFETGSLGYIGPISQKEWLIYLDVNLDSEEFSWNLNATNNETGKKQALLETRGDNKTWPGPNVDFNDGRVAWSYTSYDETENCTKTNLGTINLNTGKQTIMDAIWADNGPYLWSSLATTKNYIIVEQDLPDSKGGDNDLFLYDVDRGERKKITENGHSSMPDASYPWVIWKNSRRFERGFQNVIFNLETQKRKTINVPGGASLPPDPQVDGPWLYWNMLDQTGSGMVYLYNLKKEQVYKMSAPNDREAYSDIDIFKDTIVWSRYQLKSQGDSIIEWAKLP